MSEVVAVIASILMGIALLCMGIAFGYSASADDAIERINECVETVTAASDVSEDEALLYCYAQENSGRD